MYVQRALHSSICASCRLRTSIAAKQIARSRRVNLKQSSRFLSSSRRFRLEEKGQVPPVSKIENDAAAIAPLLRRQRPEDAALRARQTFGDALPDGYLNEEEYRMYERLYGRPLKYEEQTEIFQEEIGNEEDLELGTGVLRESADGVLEEVEFDDDEEFYNPEDLGHSENLATETPVGARLVHQNARLQGDIQASLSGSAQSLEGDTGAEADESFERAHPLTLATRFSTSPSTLPLPKSSLTAPIESQISAISNVHLQQAALRLFGGVGLPYSTSTPNLAKTMQAKSIPLDAGQGQMSEIEGDVFSAVLMPGMYASVMSVLVETRKRLGSAWAEELVQKAEQGDLRILDAGGAGSGVLAVREMLKAEWERMHEDNPIPDSGMALAEADGRVGGASVTPPLGHATVLTGSDVLRKRASRLLENTSFVPRLPDYVHTTEQKERGKFDIIVAPHTLWGLREDWARREHVENLWSLLRQDGGVLVLLEKGVPRGFEVVAAARQHLLDACFESPTNSELNGELHRSKKAKGMIVAPCTNHASCPMYQPQGMLKGRRDICHFSQRYVRPSFLQKILGAKDKNFEDVKISYLSVMRGRDLRQPQTSENAIVVKQDERATLQAFGGYEYLDTTTVSSEEQHALALSLPRAVLPPLKRRGHVILDLCTPSGTLERWTVPKSFSKQAFRDARKSSWGDLWALGAKTRVLRVVRGKKRRGGDDSAGADLDVKLVKRTGVGKGKVRKGKVMAGD